eukprot:scaffold283888_cov41-Prasinocladus_malaysianus.AAC.1
MGFEQQLLARLKELLGQVDLATTTERQLRKSLEAEFECDLSEYKPKIRACVEQYLAENGEEEEEEEAEGEDDEEQVADFAVAAAEPTEKVPFGPLYVLSPEMAAFLGVDKMQRTQVLKHVWAYVKSNQLQNGKDIHPDRKLQTIFEFPLTGPGIMKQLGKHLLEKIEGSALPRPPKAKKRKGAAAEGDKPKKPRGGGGFQKQYRLSDQMASFVGATSMSRPETI